MTTKKRKQPKDLDTVIYNARKKIADRLRGAVERDPQLDPMLRTTERIQWEAESARQLAELVGLRNGLGVALNILATAEANRKDPRKGLRFMREYFDRVLERIDETGWI